MCEKPKLPPPELIREGEGGLVALAAWVIVAVVLALLVASCVQVHIDLTAGDKLERPTIEQVPSNPAMGEQL